jgi:hypothetical protein
MVMLHNYLIETVWTMQWFGQVLTSEGYLVLHTNQAVAEMSGDAKLSQEFCNRQIAVGQRFGSY